MKAAVFLIALVGLMACQEKTTKVEKETENLSADQIVEKAIEQACSGNCDDATIEFRFRKNFYRSVRKDGMYTFERQLVDSTGVVTRDVLKNTGFERFVNDQAITLPDSLTAAYANSVNSVHYFVQLPYGLNAPAANKELVGQDSIGGEPYYEIAVHFNQEGGGADYEDQFLYWIHKEHFTVDYLAYSYQVEGGGVRFREAYNPRVVEGIRFVDYKNYSYEQTDVDLAQLDDIFQKENLPLLSTIEIEDIQVTLPKYARPN